MQLERINLVCDDLERAAAFWQGVFGLVPQAAVDPYNPERRLLLIGTGDRPFLEYACFPGQPGDRGSGDLRRLELAVGPDVWLRLTDQIGRGVVEPLPDGRLAVLEPQTGLLVVCRSADG